MAQMSVRSTYALDPETVGNIARLAGRWNVSKSEALRRAVREATLKPETDPTAALERLQKAAAGSKQAMLAWADDVRRERQAGRWKL